MSRLKKGRGFLWWAVLLAGLAGLCAAARDSQTPQPIFAGVFWQPDCDSARRISDYRPLGAGALVVQWLTVEAEQFDGQETSACALNWPDIQRRSGGLPLIVGLSGAYHPTPADLPALAAQSRTLAALPSTQALHPAGYYAPVELRPDWPAATVRAYLDALPRPLWVSAYAGAGGYGPALTEWLMQAVPDDVFLLVQDGVGVGHATPQQAAEVVRALDERRSAPVGIVVEVFRPSKPTSIQSSNLYRSAYPWELDAQLSAYQGLTRYAFDGGHYMSAGWIRAFLVYQWARKLMGNLTGDLSGILTGQHALALLNTTHQATGFVGHELSVIHKSKNGVPDKDFSSLPSDRMKAFLPSPPAGDWLQPLAEGLARGKGRGGRVTNLICAIVQNSNERHISPVPTLFRRFS